MILAIRLSGLAFAQEPALLTDRNKSFKEGQEYFRLNLYEAARSSMEQFKSTVHPSEAPVYTKLTDEAQLIYHLSGLRQGLEQSENELRSFILDKLPDPIVYPAVTELGSHYYNKKQYKSSIEAYDLIDLSKLSTQDMAEAGFKKGYCYFVTRNFSSSRKEFVRIKDLKSEYYSATNYYLGVSDYYLGNYNDAASGFQKIADDPEYKAYIPYNLCQIYFATSQYDKVISTAEKSLKIPDLFNRKEIRLLTGQSYFIQKQYANALPHLEYYESNTDKLTEDEFYQLAFTQYQLKKYDQAISNFLPVSQSQSELGQNANFYLADAYLKTGDRNSARAAFRNVSQMSFDNSLKEEALYNYGKLSAEMGFERESLSALSSIDTKSAYFDKSNEIIYRILNNSEDYDHTLDFIDKLPSRNEKLKSLYQHAAVNSAMIKYREGNKADALVKMNASLKYRISRSHEATALFWIAQISHENGKYETSLKEFNNYFELSNGLNNLPEESQPFMAHYTQGYNYLTLQKYKDAERSFKNSITGFNLQKGKLKNTVLTAKIYPDAMIRTGDCVFKQKNYKEALQFYSQAIATRSGNFVYAIYQKAVIEGLTGEPYEKILTLNDLKRNHPDSEYADDALMQLGDTYLTLGSTDNAYASFTELVNNYKNKSKLITGAYLKMGLIAYNRGDMQTALKNYKEVFNHNPDAQESQSALLGLEEIYINDLGKADEYIRFLETLPGNSVNSFTADSLSFKVGELRYKNGEYEKALSGFEQYLRQYPKGFYHLQAHYLTAECYTLLKQYDKALQGYEVLIKAGTNPHYESSIRKAALISYNHSQDFEKALLYYDLHYQITKNQDEKYQAAMSALRSAFRLSKDTETNKYAEIIIGTKDALREDLSAAHYYLAKVAFRNKKYQQALVAFGKTAELANNNQAAESRYMIAEIYYLQSEFVKAEEQCNAANKLNNLYPYWIAKSLLLLSDIYIGKNDLFNARAALEAVIEHFKEDATLTETAKVKLKALEIKEQESNRLKLNNNSGVLPLQNRKG
jgi:tetratricopeptide (TPR) repeat protein